MSVLIGCFSRTDCLHTFLIWVVEDSNNCMFFPSPVSSDELSWHGITLFTCVIVNQLKCRTIVMFIIDSFVCMVKIINLFKTGCTVNFI